MNQQLGVAVHRAAPRQSRAGHRRRAGRRLDPVLRMGDRDRWRLRPGAAGRAGGAAADVLARTLVLLAAGLAVAEAVNLGAIMVTAYTAPARLRAIHSLTALAGRTALPPVSPVSGAARPGVQAVVLGDSTAAGLGNAPLPHPSKQDKACHRSADTYAADLAAATGWQVLNLACSGATIPAGILGPQQTAGVTVPPQLAVAKKATRASVVIVSIGADDVGWSALLRLCAASRACDNRASVAYFQQRLAAFARQLLPAAPAARRPAVPSPGAGQPLLRPVRHQPALPGQCRPAPGQGEIPHRPAARPSTAPSPAARRPPGCLRPAGLHRSRAVRPRAVRAGPHDPAPFHPTPAGELAIALADEHALDPGTTPAQQPSPSQHTPPHPPRRSSSRTRRHCPGRPARCRRGRGRSRDASEGGSEAG